MDGNRRWAKERGLDTLVGHQQGQQAWEEIVFAVRDLGIAHAVFYAFSTENWKRSEVEVSYLMDLFSEHLSRMSERLPEQRVRIRIIGRRTDFSGQLQEQMLQLETDSAQYVDTTIWIALSYGGRAEIVDAVNEAVKAGKKVDEATFASLLWSHEMPDPDLVIRTGGEQRLSNFLPWHSIYSELYFTDTYWPAFTKEEFHRIVEWYGSRERRRGR